MCLIVNNCGLNVSERMPLINTKVRLKNTVHLPDRILPAGSVYTLKTTTYGQIFLEDSQGTFINNYYNIANFERVM